jgi:hypothetical protein
VGPLLPPESHLSDEQVDAYLDGHLAEHERLDLDRHLAACAACARDLEALRRPASLPARARPIARRRWLAIAASAAAAAVVVPMLRRRSLPSAPDAARRSSSPLGFDDLPADEQRAVAGALEAGVATPPADLGRLRGRREALMGEPLDGSFRLRAPVGTVVSDDRPAFRWDPLQGARAYTVIVVDEDLQPVQKSPRLTGTTWVPDSRLARGQAYAWEVLAHRPEDEVSAPAPPLPPARFRVLDEPRKARLDRFAAAHPRAHLLLGILQAQAGLVDEARDHLARVPSDDPYFEVARRTLAALD